MSQFEQHANIKFIWKVGKSSETLSALQQVYSDTAQKKPKFKNVGRCWRMTSTASGRPSTSRTKEIVEKV
jgi:hypothetical protein